MYLSNSPQRFLSFAAILLGLFILVHAQGLYGQFMVDDFSYVTDKKKPEYDGFLANFSFRNGAHYNPLDVIVNRTLFKVFKEPFQLHLVNLGLFYVSCLLLFVFVEMISQNFALAILSSLYFAIHPMNAEIIDHLTLNIVIIAGILQQAAIIFFWKAEKENKNFYFLTFIFFLGALLSHETALLFPLYIFCLVFFVKKENLKSCLLKTFPFLILSILYFLLWMKFAGEKSPVLDWVKVLQVPWYSYPATFLHLLGWYIGNLGVPNDIVFIRNLEPLRQNLLVWNSLVVALVAGVGFVIARWKRSFSNFALIWFLAAFILAVPAAFGHTYMGMVIEPNWFYFSSQGFFLLVAWFLLQLRHKIGRLVFMGMLGSLGIYWVICTQFQHVASRSEWGYADYWLHKSPQNLQATMILGTLYSYGENYEIKPEFIPDMVHLAELYVAAENYDRASRLIEKLLRQYPSLERAPTDQQFLDFVKKIRHHAYPR